MQKGIAREMTERLQKIYASVPIGDTVTAEAEVIESRADKPITRLRCVARRSDGAEVLRGECVVYTMRPE